MEFEGRYSERNCWFADEILDSLMKIQREMVIGTKAMHSFIEFRKVISATPRRSRPKITVSWLVETVSISVYRALTAADLVLGATPTRKTISVLPIHHCVCVFKDGTEIWLSLKMWSHWSYSPERLLRMKISLLEHMDPHSGTLAALGINEASGSLRGTLAARDRITIRQCFKVWRVQASDCVISWHGERWRWICFRRLKIFCSSVILVLLLFLFFLSTMIPVPEMDCIQ